MTCAETQILLHALLDGELDAGHARDVEGHLRECARCAGKFRVHRSMQEAIASAGLRFDAPLSLHRRIEKALPAPPQRSANRRAVLKGFVMGTALSPPWRRTWWSASFAATSRNAFYSASRS